MRAVTVSLVVGGVLLAASAANAQINQIKPRVMIMLDTSGSMTEHIDSNTDSFADGSSMYKDPVMTRDLVTFGNLGMYPGRETAASLMCPAPGSAAYDGVNSRLYNGKSAITNVINGSGDIDWGLMRYSGTNCAVVGTFTQVGNVSCTADDDCPNSQFCVGGKCGTDNNLCFANTYGGTDRYPTAGTCGNHYRHPTTYSGSCGTASARASGACATPQTCSVDTDCSGTLVGRCTAIAGSAAKSCVCNGGTATCPGNYACTAGRCVYDVACQSPGGTILADPSVVGFSNSQVLPFVDGIEDYTNDGTGKPKNPELRAVGSTPLAGAARSATNWYNSVVGADAQKACRPYVLVQVTDGFDTCENGNTAPGPTAGPVAAAQGFVAATVAGKPSKPLNKVYMIGLNISSPTLDAVAAAGGTGQARLATSQQDIEAALADIVASSVLVEKCNGFDDNCNGQCDENFPGVAVTAAGSDGQGCSNPHSAASCDNGFPAGSQCFDSGIFVCSTDTLSQVCSAQSCVGSTGGTVSSPAAGVMRISSVSGIASSAVGQLLVIGGSSKPANNGAFVVTAVGASTVDVTNAGVTTPDPSVVSYGVPTMQGSATITRPAAGVERLTVTTSAGVKVGDQVTVVNAAPAADNGTFTVSAITATTIDLTNASAIAGTAPGLWEDARLCPGVETCNNKDDDCNGVIDDCTPGVPGSCCMTCQPQSETCNGKDDNCNGVIDDNPIDAGGICNNNNIGDCAPSIFACCTTDPNLGGCMQGATDKLWCKGGNPGFPVAGADLCDGTDDNCNGTPNDGPPKICYENPAGMTILTMGQDGVGACHHGSQQCSTLPLPAGDPGCPVGWPAGKVCPNPTKTYGACTGTVGPQNEACNGVDDDCDGTIDDNLKDPWADPTNPSYATAHPCCSTGNPADCMNTGASPPAMCHLGGYQCVAGMKTCVNSQAKTVEVCNGIDDDCNGIIDDVPGVGTPCTGPGIITGGECKAVLKCVAGNTVPQCVQTQGPVMETCNGKDDNCNGQIDDNNPPLAVNPLPGVGVACMVPMPPQDKPPCKAGLTVCVAGTIQCQGAVGPTPNQCNGISTDCTGMPNTNGNCPSGFQCYQGNCVAPCQAGEFPCPGGYACNLNTTQCDSGGNHVGCCVPDACAQLTCPAGFNCKLDAQGMASCVDPCTTVTCPPSYICKLGACVDGSCRTQGCPDPTQVCKAQPDNSFACEPDPCANVTCGSNQFCQSGVCVGACAGPCPTGQFCNQGQCVADPCAHTPCVEGQVCRVTNGVAVCVENQCQFGCNIGQACCGGECVADGCENLHCPEDTHCTLTPDCSATCETNPASPKDQVVGAGGGGFGCAVAGHGSEPSSLAWLFLVAGALLFRRRRAAEVRK